MAEARIAWHSRRREKDPVGPVSDDQLAAALRVRLYSTFDAAPAAGSFPLVLMVNHVGHGVLVEYLASHGYVVAAVPLLGTSPAWRAGVSAALP